MILQLADAVEVMLLSVLGPVVKCQWNLSATEEAAITSVSAILFSRRNLCEPPITSMSAFVVSHLCECFCTSDVQLITPITMAYCVAWRYTAGIINFQMLLKPMAS